VTAGRVLAVDGGNSKTDLALLDPNGALLSMARGPGSNLHVLGTGGAVEVLDALLQRALAEAGLATQEPAAANAHVLIAGADLPEERSAIQASIEQLKWSDRVVVDIDMPALLRAGTDRGWGIAVGCGAGVNGYGRTPDGREVRFLSLGAISGDWGGGPDIGLAGLSAAVRSADGRGPQTALESAVAAHFGLADALDVSREIHRGHLPVARVAELATVVVACADRDPVAAGIVARLADELIAYARAAAVRLDLLGSDPDVVLGGGLLRALPPSAIEKIDAGVRERVPGAHVLVAASDPIVGAALLGLDHVGADAGAHERARSELDAATGALVGQSAPNPGSLRSAAESG
jgi:N-acetylglucosamine kinase-like BadF-type ATPase